MENHAKKPVDDASQQLRAPAREKPAKMLWGTLYQQGQELKNIRNRPTDERAAQSVLATSVTVIP